MIYVFALYDYLKCIVFCCAVATNGLQICDGQAFQHKCSCGELNFL